MSRLGVNSGRSAIDGNGSRWVDVRRLKQNLSELNRDGIPLRRPAVSGFPVERGALVQEWRASEARKGKQQGGDQCSGRIEEHHRDHKGDRSKARHDLG
jgi:hypothetical protein